MTVPLSEIFLSLQGEGPFIGTPTLFVRFGKCNLNCPWCDTPQKDGDGYQELEFSVVQKQILDMLVLTGAQVVTFTGGEPLMGSAAEFINEFLFEARRIPVKVHVESNGLFLVRKMKVFPRIRLFDSLVVSPKIDMDLGVPFYDFIWKWMDVAVLHSNIYFKFVVGTKQEFETVEYAVSQILRNSLLSGRIFVQQKEPQIEGRLSLKDLANLVLASDVMKENEVRVLPRLHKLLNLR